jgi:hypothetical protein
LSETEVTFTFPSMRDGEPQDVALEAVRDYERMLTFVIGYAEDLERMVVNASMQDALDIIPGSPDPYPWAQQALELAQLVRAAGALAVAQKLAREARETLETPALERKRVGD